jgi:hypothetical protein
MGFKFCNAAWQIGVVYCVNTFFPFFLEEVTSVAYFSYFKFLLDETIETGE